MAGLNVCYRSVCLLVFALFFFAVCCCFIGSRKFLFFFQWQSIIRGYSIPNSDLLLNFCENKIYLIALTKILAESHIKNIVRFSDWLELICIRKFATFFSGECILVCVLWIYVRNCSVAFLVQTPLKNYYFGSLNASELGQLYVQYTALS